MKISASIIIFNEAQNIEALCESLDFCDEIVLVDSNSSDNSVELARKYTDKIYQREFKGYKDKHQFADAQTTGDWILWMDADERITPELRQSIEKLRELPTEKLPDGFKIARRTYYLTRWIKHCGWYPDYQMRLYRKDRSFWDGVAPHETARVRGRVDKLDGEILHYTKNSLSEYHRVIDSYTTLAADYKFKTGETSGGVKMIIAGLSGFIRSYFVKQGFRDGVPGLIISVFTAYSVFLKYAKVWEHHHSKDKIKNEK